MVEDLKIVGVMGSGSDRREELSYPLGTMLANLGVHLLTGGGAGVMAAVAEAFTRVETRNGRSIGIIPAERGGGETGPPEGYPNPFVEIPIRTHLPVRGEAGTSRQSRNWINILSADALVILPGGAGTRSEVKLALELGRPAIGFGGGGANLVPQADGLREVEQFLREALER